MSLKRQPVKPTIRHPDISIFLPSDGEINGKEMNFFSCYDSYLVEVTFDKELSINIPEVKNSKVVCHSLTQEFSSIVDLSLIESYFLTHQNKELKFALIFDITSKKHPRRISYDKTNVFLTDAINLEDSKLFPQISVDLIAQELNVSRPEQFLLFDSKDMFFFVDRVKDIKGIVIYSNFDQTKRIVHSTDFLCSRYN